MRKKSILALVLACTAVPLLVAAGASAQGPLTPQEQLGKFLFFDTSLSTPSGQACAACHAPSTGWTGPASVGNAHGAVYEGAFAGRFGNRKPPASAYAGDSPPLYYDVDEEVWVGGMFWDGRATGWRLGDPLAEQALGPFLNPAEQNNPSAEDVIGKVLASPYWALFRQLCPDADPVNRYDCIGRAIAAYERSDEVNPFTSKYDYWLQGRAKLTGQERRGLELFNGKGKCNACHLSDGPRPLFTDFTYDNAGIPRNPVNPFYDMPYNPDGENWIDPGLGGFLKAAGFAAADYEPQWGKQKVPSLRNVDLRPDKKFVKAYGHNGYFKSLQEIVRFYNTRDVPGASWPAPEVAANVNTTELGNLGLNHGEERAIVEFLKTLSDGYVPKK